MKASKLLLTACIAVVGAIQANAVIILSPDDSNPPLVLFGDQTSQAQINTAIANAGFPNGAIYKDEVGTEEGPAAAYYTTTYEDPNYDTANAVITWDGPGKIAAGTTYFLIKDGNAATLPAGEHGWYLFEVNWDGMETVVFEGFYAGDQDRISHVTIYGNPDEDCCDTPGIPDAGASLMLLGMALVGVEGLRRRLTK